MNQTAVIGAFSAGVFVTAGMWLVLQPYRRLAPRLRPYAAVSRSRLTRSFDVRGQAGAWSTETTVQRLFGPILDGFINWFSQLIGAGNDEELALRLRHGGLYPNLPPEAKVREYRLRSFGQSFLAMGAAGLFGFLAGGTRTMVLFGILGMFFGITITRSRLNSAISKRKERLRGELYTFNQLIAMRTRVGGGVIEAIRHATDRGNGVFVEELDEVLRLHATGMPITDALRRAALLSADAEAQRTYNVLATAQDRGADLGDALLDLSQDLRAQRRDEVKRQAARRRLALVIPIVIVLAPILLIFIGAPLPSIIFGVG